MAALSQQTPSPEVLAQVANNIVSYGYSLGHPTVHLVLLEQYLEQADELRSLAGRGATLRVNCRNAAPLLRILGYRITGQCGAAMDLVTANAKRAFLTVDSGFPLPALAAALRSGHTFVQPYGETEVALLFAPSDWALAYSGGQGGELAAAAGPVLTALLRHRELAQLYAGLAAMDPATRNELRHEVGVRGLLPIAAALYFYGAHLVIRSGRVLVPGGEDSAAAWGRLVGARPSSPAAFIRRVSSRDHGWLAAYYDDLWRLPARTRAHFMEPGRLRRDYAALRRRLRDKQMMRSAVGYSFRPDTALLLLLRETVWQPDGELLVPGGVAAWREIWQRARGSRLLREWSAQAGGLRTPDDVLAELFAFSRLDEFDDNARPLRTFLMISAMDRTRAATQELSPPVVMRLAADYARFGDQYETLIEFPALNNTAILRFLTVAAHLDLLPGTNVRSNAVGIFQSEIELWKILARQGEITPDDATFVPVLNPFLGARTAPQVYAAGWAALGSLYTAAAGPQPMSESGWTELLAGPPQTSAAGRQVHREMVAQLRTRLQDQRLVSLDALLDLGRGLTAMAAGQPQPAGLLELARRLRDFELPQPVLPGRDRLSTPADSLAQRHAALQTHVDLTGLLARPARPQALLSAVGQLTPFLRDTLVGYTYAYYDPPGGELLANDPLLVRLHDFSGNAAATGATPWQTPVLVDRGASGSEGVHLAGSLANLPYVLARAEEDFLTPSHVQSLIWDAVGSGLISGAVVPRWWRVSSDELHAAALYQRMGGQMVELAARDPALREPVEHILGGRMLPRRASVLAHDLTGGDGQAAAVLLLPSDRFALAAQIRQQYPSALLHWGGASAELEALARRDPEAANAARIAHDFGVPHPILEHSYALGMLEGPPLPSMFDYSSRLLAESWDSDNLYWGRLAWQMGYPPVALNVLIPRLSERMVENISASNLQDWPALLRALRATGRQFLAGQVAGIPPAAAYAAAAAPAAHAGRPH